MAKLKDLIVLRTVTDIVLSRQHQLLEDSNSHTPFRLFSGFIFFFLK